MNRVWSIISSPANSRISSGPLAVGMDRHPTIPYWFREVAEMDFLGNITTTYEIDDYMHHSVEEFPGGNILIAGTKAQTTGEDVIYKFNRTTGNLVENGEFDFNEILNRSTGGIPEERFAVIPPTPRAGLSNGDWAHINGISYDQSDDTFIFSIRQQSAVVKIRRDGYTGTEEIRWILGFPAQWGNLNSRILTSGHSPEKGWPDWPYGQHSVQALGNGRVLVFNNGTNRGNLDPSLMTLVRGSSVSSNQIQGQNSLNRNQVVEYRVNGATITKEWEFEAPDAAYNSPILGSARELENGNR